jgi:hypothetical protein
VNRIRYAMCAILAFGGLGHLYGTFDGYPIGSEVFVWSLSGAALIATVIVMNFFARSGDRSHIIAAATVSLAWCALALAFGSAVGSVFDPRALTHAIPSAVLFLVNVYALQGHVGQVVRQ